MLGLTSRASAQQEAEHKAQSIKNSLTPNQYYEDPDITLISYLARRRSPYAMDPSKVTWKRPAELSPSPQLFCDGFQSGDIKQGHLGDCWFLGALSCLATRNDLLQPLIAGQYPEHGFYQFLFYKDARWQVVTVDDRLPTMHGKLLFASCPDQNEFWVPLMEKAYAKLNGGYDSLASGSPAYALADLTGGQSEKVNFIPLGGSVSSRASTFNSPPLDQIWNYLRRAVQEEWLMGVSVFDPQAQIEQQRPDGLLMNHAYGLLTCIEESDIRLVQLRNPWGRKEWTGDWGDGSDKWNTPLGKKIISRTNHQLKDDGTFFLSLIDFGRIFNKVYTVRLYQDAVGPIWPCQILPGRWAGRQAVGCQDTERIAQNPQIGLQCSGSTKLFLTLTQRDERLSGQPHVNIGFFLCRVSGGGQRLSSVNPGNLVARSHFSNAREVSLDQELTSGSYVIIPSTYEPGKETDYFLTVSSQQPVQLQNL